MVVVVVLRRAGPDPERQGHPLPQALALPAERPRAAGGHQAGGGADLHGDRGRPPAPPGGRGGRQRRELRPRLAGERRG